MRCAIGLDVGGTKIAGGLVAFPAGGSGQAADRPPSAEVLAKRLLPTDAGRGGEAVLADTLALAAELLKVTRQDARDVLGIGVAVCELVDPAGNITSGQTVAWEGLPVRERFAALAPSVIESDVRAAALAEARLGAGRPFRLSAYVTVGTGISSCLVQDGRPFAGARGNALVLASAPWSMRCPACETQVEQVLEEFASGPALVERYSRTSARPVSRAEEVLALAAAGDPDAGEIVRTAGEALGNAVGHLTNVLDPEAVIVGGGLGLAGGLYWERFVTATRAHIWSEATRALPILPAALGVDAGLIGAAAALWTQER